MPSSSKRSRSNAGSASPSKKRVRFSPKSPDSKVNWVGRAVPAVEDERVVLKRGMREFGYYSSRPALIKDMCAWEGEPQPLYEVIDGTLPCRLMFDVEAEYFMDKPSDEVSKAWFKGLMDLICSTLPKGADLEYLTTCSCRVSGRVWKYSYHVTFPNIIFENIGVAMKEYVQTYVYPVVQSDIEFTWLYFSKKVAGKKEPRCAIDDRIYTKNRAWRMTHASKNEKDALVPWDVDNWIPLEFKDSTDHEEWFAKTLCDDAQGDLAIPARAVPEPTPEPAKPPPKLSKLFKDARRYPKREFVSSAIGFFSEERRSNYNLWTKMGWAIATVFGDNSCGKHLFREFSEPAANYDQAACDKKYDSAKGEIGFKSIVKWIKEDDPTIAEVLITRYDRAVDEVPEIVEWAGETRLNPSTAASMFEKNRKKKKSKGGYFLEGGVQYINQFLSVINKQTKTEYAEKMDGAVIFRDASNLMEAYGKAPWLDAWRKHKDRKQHDCLTFDPKHVGDYDQKLNMFFGLAHPPSQRTLPNNSTIQPMLDHILHIWCHGDVEVFEWVISWMAHCVQRPWIKIGVAIVLRSAEGAGKGVVIEKLAEVIGKNYYQHMQDAKSLLGSQFVPSGWEQCLLLFIDEAVWGGDKAQAGTLKKLITEDTHDIEHKFQSRYTVRSFMNTIFASNNTWVVPAGQKARRYLCLALDDSKAGTSVENVAYFDAVRSVPIEDWATFLHTHDLSNFDRRSPPSTPMLRDQKQLGFDNIFKFWDTCLKRGYVIKTLYEDDVKEGDDVEAVDRYWKSKISSTDVFMAYREFCGSFTSGRVQSKNMLFAKLLEIGGVASSRLTLSNGRVAGRTFPPLSACRAMMCDIVGDLGWFKDEKNYL